MKLRSILVALIASSAISLAGCGSPYSFQGVNVTISPKVASVPVNGTQVFTTTTANAPNVPLFSLNGSLLANTPGPAGMFTPGPNDVEGTITYNAPATPPIYTAAQLTQGLVQGSVTVAAAVSNNPNGGFDETSTSITFAITGPISAGISPTTASVKLGTTQQFTGYSVGSTNNAITWQVNGVTGGSASYGTISATGLYTAPAAMPMTSNVVTITVVAQADTTKTASATVTLTQ